MSSRGDDNPHILIVGEVPTEKDDELGMPFMGPAGSVLAQGLSILPEKARVHLTNAVKCSTIGQNKKTPQIKQLNACNPHLVAEIEALKPKAIVTLGAIALRAVTGQTGINRLRGTIMPSLAFDCSVIPAYHPDYLLRNKTPEIMKEFRDDIKLAYDVARGKIKEKKLNVPRAIVIKSKEKLWKLEKKLLNADIFSVDIEATGYKPAHDRASVLCVGFSVDGKTGYVVPYDHEDSKLDRKLVRQFLKKVLKSDIPKVAQNWFYDYGYLKGFGFKVKNPKHDTMLAAYLINENPGNHGLGEIGSRFTEYDNWFHGIEEYFDAIPGKNEEGIPKNYSDIEGKVLFPYCARDAAVTMAAWPNLIKRLKRESKIYRKVCVKLYGTNPGEDCLLRTLDYLCKTTINLSRISYSGWCADIDYVEELARTYPKELEKAQKRLQKKPYCREAVVIVQKAKRRKRIEKFKSEGMTLGDAIAKAKKECSLFIPFNVKSPDQKIALIYEVRGHKVRHTTPTGKPSTKKDHIGSYIETDEALTAMIKVSEMRDLYSKYIFPMINDRYKLGKFTHRYICDDGFIHPSYNLLAVTGRTKSDDPNAQNIPEHIDGADKIKSMVISRYKKGRLIGVDYGQQELRVMAALSGEPKLIDSFLKGKDPHVEAGLEIYADKQVMKLPHFKNAYKDLKKKGKDSEFRVPIKNVHFGLAYGQSAWGLCAQFGLDPENEKDLEAAETMVKVFFKKRKKLKRFLDKCKYIAKSEGCVVSLPPVARFRRVPEAMSGSPKRVNAALREAGNAPIQGPASDILLSAMNDMQNVIRKQKAQVVIWNVIHDAMYLDAHPDWIDWTMKTVKEVMERQTKKFPWLKNVPLLAEPKVGISWADL